jgi:hypothetical protein
MVIIGAPGVEQEAERTAAGVANLEVNAALAGGNGDLPFVL